MDDRYNKCLAQWNQIFENSSLNAPMNELTGQNIFDKGLKWLAAGTESVLDFGCGTGTMLFFCEMYGTRKHIGIDISNKAIEKAWIRSEKMKNGEYNFWVGGVERLQEIDSESIDAVILSNIVDNLYPDDALLLLQQTERVLKNDGKVLIKLNPYLSEKKIKEYDIKTIHGNLLDDGLLLWNNTDEEWYRIISTYFKVEKYCEIYYEEYQQTNRMFLAVKKDGYCRQGQLSHM
jgi:ubiquinone/menaquinone biosynthesis C-methylase UbiE